MASARRSADEIDSGHEIHTRKKRGYHRRPVVYAGILEFGNRKAKCVIVDISTKGAKVRTLRPYAGAFRSCMLAVSGAGRVEAKVVWHRGNELGLEFHEPATLSTDRPTSSVTEILAVLNKRL